MPTPEIKTPRLFFALNPAAEVRDRLRALQQREQNGVSWTRAENLHITLTFLGSVPVSKLPAIGEAATGLAVEPFEIVIDRVVYLPRPRMLWATPSRIVAPLIDLYRTLSERLATCGFEPEARPYAPHVTLARRLQGRFSSQAVAAIPWRVEDYCLMESVSDAAGTRYQQRQRWPLAGE